jgi:hypothetical protein
VWLFRHLTQADCLNLSSPFFKVKPALINRFLGLIGYVIHFPAKGIESIHGSLLLWREMEECQCQVGGACLGNALAVLYGWGCHGDCYFNSSEEGNPPVSERDGFLGR